MCCIKSSSLVEKSKVTPLSFKEKISLKFHLIICAGCSKYERMSNQLDSLFEGVTKIEDSSISLSDKKKQEILKQVKASEA